MVKKLVSISDLGTAQREHLKMLASQNGGSCENRKHAQKLADIFREEWGIGIEAHTVQKVLGRQATEKREKDKEEDKKKESSSKPPPQKRRREELLFRPRC